MTRSTLLMLGYFACAALVGCRSLPEGTTRKVTRDGMNIKVETTTVIDLRTPQQKLLESQPGCIYCYLNEHWEKGEPVECLLKELPPGRYARVTWEDTDRGTLVRALLVTKKRMRRLSDNEPLPNGIPVQIGYDGRFVVDE